MTEKCVLIIDDDYDFMEGPLKRRMMKHGYRVAGSIDYKKALSLIRSEKPDVILLDIFFPEGEMGKPTLEKIKNKYPSAPPVIMISDTMLKSRYNAADYQSADARYPKELLASKEDIARFVKEMDVIIDNAKGKAGLGFLVGNTGYMKENVESKIRLVADTDASVLITGETGTGKELVARAIHGLSNRNKGPFIALNCGALPDNLIESELFGYKKGAFTGAERNKPGRFELAEGGTLFIDEIGDITPALQVKFLRALREKEYEPLGGTATIKADVRIIAATNKDLQDLVNKGQYRDDLRYRLNVFPIHLPQLRERKEDIPLLAKYFIENEGASVEPVLREDVEELLFSYHWPGNIGELETTIQRAAILAKNDKYLQTIHFPDLVPEKKPASTLPSDVPDIVNRVFRKEWNWKNVEAEYAAKGETRKEVLLEIISRWKEKHKNRPSSADLSELLSVSNSNMRRILSETGVKLTRS